MTDLKPCPFCGGEAHTLLDIDKYAVGCNSDICLGFIGLSWLYDTEAEAIAAWNTRAEYHGYEQAAIEAWESIKKWNTRAELVSGTLTAEQVRTAIFNGSSYASYDGAKYYADGIGMQAIADELNNRAERTCKNANTDGYGFCFECCECGYSTIVHNCAVRLDELPNYCPNCGARVEVGE